MTSLAPEPARPDWTLVSVPSFAAPSSASGVAVRAYQVGCRGRRARGERRLRALLDETDASDGYACGYARLLLGMLQRGGCQLGQASEQLEQALDDEALSGEARVLACTMLVDSLAQQGKLAAARSALARSRVEAPLPQGVLELAHGDVEAAVDRLRAAAATTPREHRCQRLWAQLFLSNALMDLRDPSGAAGALEQVSEHLHRRGRFEEPYVFALASWLRLESLRSETSAASGSGLRRARRSATVYTAHYPRYRLLCEAFVALAQSQRDRWVGPDVAEQIVADLEAAGCILDAGRVAAQWVRHSDGSAERFTRVLRPRAVDLLRRAGAHGWLGTIEQRSAPPSIDPPTVTLDRKPAAAPASTSSSDSGPFDPPTVAFSRRELGVPALIPRIDPTTVALPRGDGQDHDIELDTLFAVNRAISSKLDIDDLLQELLGQVIEVLRAERGAVFWYEDGAFRSVASRGFGEPAGVESAVSRTVLHDAVDRRQVVLTEDAMDDLRFRNAASIIAPGVRSVLCAPLATPKRVYGALYIDTTMRTGAFTDLYRRLLEVFANQAAVAMENAVAFREIAELNADLEDRVEQRTADLVRANDKLKATLTTLEQTELRLLSAQKEALEAEMRTAAALQQAIIPGRQIIREAGAAFFGITEPASMVGGDFWTYRRFGVDRVLLLIADVSGHGVGPGMLTSFLKGCLTTLSQLGHDLGPSELLDLLSDSVREAADGQMWMTALACLYDRSTRILRATSGGHVRGFLLPVGQDSPRAVGRVGTVLGLDEESSFQTVTFEVAPGDRLLLYTDGAVECENDKARPRGARRLVQSMVQRRGEALDVAVRGIVSDCKAYCGEVPLEDDLSVVLTEFE